MGIIKNIRSSLAKRWAPFSEQTWRKLLDSHPILSGMSREELSRLSETTARFMRQKTFSGAEGFVLDDFKRAVVSIQACLPILNLGMRWYRDWKTVVVVPDIFVEEHSEEDGAGVVREWEEENSGESWDEGPVVLSWKDVEDSGWGNGYNVVIHEAAHRLDLTDGAINGRPALHGGMSAVEWQEVFSRAFHDFTRKSRRGKRKNLDGYAADSDSEFFAVASEFFFEKPSALKSDFPDVYRLLSHFYRQDPYPRIKAKK